MHHGEVLKALPLGAILLVVSTARENSECTMIAQSELDQDYELALDFLSRFGVIPPFDDEKDFENVFLAIRSQRGWEPSIEPESDGWRAEIREWRSISQTRAAVARDSDRARALLRALSLALMWESRVEEFQEFDKLVRDLLGYGGKEFLDQLERKELDVDDPLIEQLIIMRPLGY
jgi:hypothetical protein